MGELSSEDASHLVASIRQLSEMADRVLPRGAGLGDRLQAHLGRPGDVEGLPNTSASFPLVERPNLQLALDALREEGAPWREIGLPSDVGNYGGLSLVGMVAGTWRGPGPTGRQYVEAAVDVDTTIDCLAAGLVLTVFDDVPVVVLVHSSERGMGSTLNVEVLAATDDTPHRFLARLRTLMDEHNVMRGKVLTFSFGRHGDFGIQFAPVPEVTRRDVILDDALLSAIEQHALGITAHVDALRAAGQHVKRGLLLFGPPGTGKTHTISYLLNAMAGRTTFILSGAAVGAVGQAGTLARSLQPATVVIEDVDLIGMDRSVPGGSHNSLLFQLLNEMDGLSGDADVLFVLTTNRVELLEPALSARPGRIDQAIEIPLPDAGARRRLLDLYLPDDVPASSMPDEALERIVSRTDGVAAAFIKELARRATLAGLLTDRGLADRLGASLDDMIDHATPILRSSLAAEGRR